VKKKTKLTQDVKHQAFNKGLVMSDVLKRADVSAQTWNNWQRGRNKPSPLFLGRIRAVIEESPVVPLKEQRRQGRSFKGVAK